jgi:hypothetical protein
MLESRRGRVLGLLLFAMLAIAAAPATAGAAGWLPSFLVSGTGEDDSESFSPQVEADAQDDSTVVYVDQLPTTAINHVDRVVARVFFADGSASGQEVLSPDGVSAFDMDMSPDGVATVVFVSGRVQYQRVGPDGHPVGANVPLSPAGEAIANFPVIDVNADGDAIVAWQNSDASASGEFQYRTVAADGTLGAVTNLSNTAATADQFPGNDVSVAINDDGRGFAAWTEQNVATCCPAFVKGRAIDFSGATTPPIRTLSTDTGFPSDLTTAIDSTGRGTAAWGAQSTTNPFPNQINEAQVDAPGALAGTGIVSPAGTQGFDPYLAVTPQDAVIFLWDQNDPDTQALTRRMAANGMLDAGTNTVAAGGDATGLEYGPQGTGMAGYTIQPGSEDQGAVRALDANGAPTGAEHLLTADDGKEAFEVSPALGGGGSGFAVWVHENPDLSSDFDQVEGAPFDAADPTLNASVPGTATVGQAIVVGAVATDRSPVTYAWTFGDGGTADTQVAQHTYSAPGTYTVSVIAADAAGNAATSTHTVVVTSGGAGGGSAEPGPCANTLTGTAAAETLTGTAGGDRLLGLDGNDRLFGLAGADCIQGGSGNDVLNGGGAGDVLLGEGGRDRILAKDGQSDLVDCGPGRDSVKADRSDKLSRCERVKRKKK